LANYNIELSNKLYHWLLSKASFRFCETYLPHIKLFVVNKSAISPFLGGWSDRKKKQLKKFLVPRLLGITYVTISIVHQMPSPFLPETAVYFG